MSNLKLLYQKKAFIKLIYLLIISSNAILYTMKSKVIFKILAKMNKIILPSYTKRRLNLSKASKFQLGIIYWRYLITTKSL